MGSTTSSKTQFLQKMQMTVSLLDLPGGWGGVSGSTPGEFEEQRQEGPEPFLGPIFRAGGGWH